MPNSKRRKRPAQQDGDKLTAKQLQQSILQLFRANPDRRFTPKQIIQHLQLSNNKDAVRHAIEQLQADGQLKTVPVLKLRDSARSDSGANTNTNGRSDSRSSPSRHSAKSSGKGFDKPDRSSNSKGSSSWSADPEELFVGKVDLSRSGSGYIIIDGREQDVFVQGRNLAGAMNGDTVRIRIFPSRGRHKPEGEVVEGCNTPLSFFSAPTATPVNTALSFLIGSNMISTSPSCPTTTWAPATVTRWWCTSPTGPTAPAAIPEVLSPSAWAPSAPPIWK